VVDGTDFEKPVKIQSDEYKSLDIDVFIGIKSTDIPKLLECRYDALKVGCRVLLRFRERMMLIRQSGLATF
jgi:hypothetical protein